MSVVFVGFRPEHINATYCTHCELMMMPGRVCVLCGSTKVNGLFAVLSWRHIFRGGGE